MNAWSKRRVIQPGLALVLIAGTVLWVWPFAQATREMEHFCEQLPRGADLDRLRTLAQASGYELTTPPDVPTRVVDPRSFGRRQCLLDFDAQGLVRARFSSTS